MFNYISWKIYPRRCRATAVGATIAMTIGVQVSATICLNCWRAVESVYLELMVSRKVYQEQGASIVGKKCQYACTTTWRSPGSGDDCGKWVVRAWFSLDCKWISKCLTLLSNFLRLSLFVEIQQGWCTDCNIWYCVTAKKINIFLAFDCSSSPHGDYDNSCFPTQNHEHRSRDLLRSI